MSLELVSFELDAFPALVNKKYIQHSESSPLFSSVSAPQSEAVYTLRIEWKSLARPER